MMSKINFTVMFLLVLLFITGCEDSFEVLQLSNANNDVTRSSAVFDESANNSNYVKDFHTALEYLNTYIKDYHFHNGPASTEGMFGFEYHIQGISYWNGNYYITRSRPSGENNQQLLILNEASSKIISALTLDRSSTHPSSLQIDNGILAVAFSNPDRLKLYDLKQSPFQPLLKAELNNAGGIGTGITEYNNNYLVATYTGRAGEIIFRLFDKSFNLIEENIWDVTNQNKNNWFPFNNWQDKPGKNIYENINLIREQASPSSRPNYYLIMYCTDPERLDIFSLRMNGLDLKDIDIQMINAKEMKDPGGGGFRMGAGLAITDDNKRVRFFSTRKHIHSSYSDNTITQYNPYPWSLGTFQFETGVQTDISIDDYGNCLALFRNSKDEIFYKVGKVNLFSNIISWGGSYELKDSKIKSTGKHISVSLNNNGYCVATHRGSGKNLYYRVGKINSIAKIVDWGAENKYDTGGDMSVAINNNNQLIEVHQGYASGSHYKNHYYSVGTISTSSKTIIWKKNGQEFDTGGSIAIALDDYGRCLNVHLGSQSSISHKNNRYYRNGVANFTNGNVTWANSIQYDTGGDGDIAISNNRQCLEVHRGSQYSLSHANNHYYKIGTFNFTSNTSHWSQEAQFQTGNGSISCDLNNNGIGICAYENNGKLYYRIAVLND